MNPYRHLYSKCRHLFIAEEKLSLEERKQNEWLLTFKIADKFRVLIGKGGANTVFYQFGDGKRKVCYPEEMLDLLENLAKKKFLFFEAGKHLFVNESSIKKILPKGVVRGYTETGVKVVYKAVPTFEGSEWKQT